MELGISGRKALVCASSKGLGKACATALAEAGCEVFVNGRDAAALRETAGEIRRKAGVTVIEVVADLMTEAGRAAVIEACRSEEHTSELQSLMRISYAVFCLKKKNR